MNMHKNYVFIYYSPAVDASVILYYLDKGTILNTLSSQIRN